MARPWIRWLRWIAIVVAALALLWAVWWLWLRLSPPWDIRTVIASVIAALALLAGIWWLWWQLPRRQVARLSLKIRDPKARADVEDNLRKTVGQVLGGAAVLIGAGAAYLQFSQQQQASTQQIIAQQKIASDQIAAQQQVAEVSRKASQDLLISNQVAKGFEQLGSDKVAVRLGGIYALEGVMNTSDQYHQPVLEALCAFVREGTIGKTVNEKEPATDIQAALTVIGRREPGAGVVNLTGANIPGADLSKASLSGANLTRTDLSGAQLEHADLSRATLANTVLRKAKLEDANLSGAQLIVPDLTEANLFRADLRDTHIFGTDLSKAGLLQSQLDQACGVGGPKLPERFTLKPCRARPPVAPSLNQKTTP